MAIKKAFLLSRSAHLCNYETSAFAAKGKFKEKIAECHGKPKSIIDHRDLFEGIYTATCKLKTDLADLRLSIEDFGSKPTKLSTFTPEIKRNDGRETTGPRSERSFIKSALVACTANNWISRKSLLLCFRLFWHDLFDREGDAMVNIGTICFGLDSLCLFCNKCF